MLYSKYHTEVGRTRERVLKESAAAKEALGAFSGYPPSYTKGDLNSAIGYLKGSFVGATKGDDNSTTSGGIRHSPTDPLKSESIISPEFQGNYVINAIAQPPKHTSSTLDHEADTRQGTTVQSWRTNKMCISYTISEDLSGDHGNQILSRICQKTRNSSETMIRTRSYHIDSQSLRHGWEASQQPSSSGYMQAFHTKPFRKPVGPRQSKVAGDMASQNRAPTGTSKASDESMRFVVRSNLELENTAKDHPLYYSAAPKDDGFYHCPWEGHPTCQHKPEILKCNYEYEFSLLLSSSQDANPLPLLANL